MACDVEIDDLHTTKISLPIQLSSANQAEEFVRRWGERCELEGKILFRLAFVVNEVVAGIVQLSEVVGVKGNIEIEVDTYTRHITVNISFPDSIPLDPTFNHSDELLEEFPELKLQPDIFWHHALLKWVDKATWSKSWKKTTISLIQHARVEEKAGELYFLSLTPKLAEGLELSLLPGDMIIAKTPEMETALRLGPQEGFVLNSIDGRIPVREIYYSFVKKFGLIHPQTLGSLIENLIERGLIVPDAPLSDLHKEEGSTIKRIINRIFKLRYSIPNADGFTETINQKIGWLWSVKASYLYSFFILSSVILFSFHLPSIKVLAVGYFTKKLFFHPEIWIGFYLGMGINIIFHELSHAVVCKKYGGRVHEIGIMLYYASFCAFADTTDAWMFKNKWHRVMVSLAGPLSSLILACIFGWGWVLCMHLGGQNLSLIFGAVFLVGMLTAFIQFIPFIETDGYYISMDILEMPNLRRKSFSCLRALLGAFLKRRPKPKLPKRERRIYVVYSILALVSVISLLIILLHFVLTTLTKHPGVFAWVLGAMLVVLFFERAIKAGLNWYKRTYLAPMDLKIGAVERQKRKGGE